MNQCIRCRKKMFTASWLSLTGYIFYNASLHCLILVIRWCWCRARYVTESVCPLTVWFFWLWFFPATALQSTWLQRQTNWLFRFFLDSILNQNNRSFIRSKWQMKHGDSMEPETVKLWKKAGYATNKYSLAVRQWAGAAKLSNEFFVQCRVVPIITEWWAG